VDDKLLESLRWAESMAKLGLLREDQIAEAAALRAAALNEAEAGQIPRSASRPLSRHRAMRDVRRIREKVRRSKM